MARISLIYRRADLAKDMRMYIPVICKRDVGRLDIVNRKFGGLVIAGELGFCAEAIKVCTAEMICLADIILDRHHRWAFHCNEIIHRNFVAMQIVRDQCHDIRAK